MSLAQSGKLLLTGATGYLGSHILQQLLHSPLARNLQIVATTTGRNPKKVQELKDHVIKSDSSRVKIEVAGIGGVSSTQLTSLTKREGFDYIIHTACPFIKESDGGGTDWQQIEKTIVEYKRDTTQMISDALDKKDRTKKIVLTGAASSVVGGEPSADTDFVYSDPLHWATIDEQTRPNERIKHMTERAVWGLVSER